MPVQSISAGSVVDWVETPAAVVPAAQDFWRTAPGNALPDGITDVQDDMGRNGRVSIAPNFGAGVPQTPVAALDIFGFAGRSGVDGRVVNVTPLYVTGNLPATSDVTTPPATLVGGVEFRHSNQTQGIGIGYDAIYATGSTVNQALHFMQRGAGIIQFIHQALNGGFNYFDKVSSAITINQGWQNRYYAGGVNKMTMFHRQAALGVGGTLGMETYDQRTNAAGGFSNAFWYGPSATDAGTFTFMVDPSNVLNDAKIVLWGFNSPTFYGFGVKSSTLAYFIGNTASFHRWYAGPAPGTLLFSVSGVGNVTIDPLGVAAGVGIGPVLRFGSESSTDWIKSQRTVADRFQNDIEIQTAGARRFAVLNTGRIYMATVPTFATQALALAGGLAVGEVYKDIFGALRIVL